MRLEKVQWKTAIGMVARSASADVIFRDGVWIVGHPAAADASLLIRRVRGLSAQDIERALGTVLEEQKRRVVYQDGLVVIADSAGTLVRVSGILDELEAVRVPQWAIQLYLVTLTSRDAQDLGIEATPALDLAVSHALGSAASVEPVKLDASLKTVLRAAAERSSVSVTAQPLFLLLDGSTATFNRGTQMPIAQRTVTDQGTVTDTGVQFVGVGTDVEISIREAAGNALRLDLRLQLSDLVEVTGAGYPRTDQRSYKASSIVEDGGTYLLTSVEMGQKRKTVGNMLRWGQADDDTAELLHVWCRCRRVGGPALLSPAKEKASAVAEHPPQILAVPAKRS